MNRAHVLLPICLLLGSCVTRDYITDEGGTVAIRQLKDLSGSYKDRSDSRGGTTPTRLDSTRLVSTLMGGSYELGPVDEIRLTAPLANVLSCQAISDGHVVLNKRLQKGVDFKLDEGQLVINGSWTLDGAGEVGGVWVDHFSSAVQLLASGDLLVRSKYVSRGVAFILFPQYERREADYLHRRIR